MNTISNIISTKHIDHIATKTGISPEIITDITYFDLLTLLDKVIVNIPAHRTIKGGEHNPSNITPDRVVVYKDDTPKDVIDSITLMIVLYSIRIINENKDAFINAGYIKQKPDSSIYY